MGEAVLRAEGLVKRFGDVTAVDGLSFPVREGEVFGLLGPNGAGKTTTIRMLCGLLTPDSGRLFYRGREVVATDEAYRTRVGLCPQEIVLWPRLTCGEQLQFMGQMYGLTGAAARRRGEGLLDELGLADRRDRQARTLSGGMQRRLNLALALVHDPEIVVLDEPEAGLDPQSRVRVREFVRSLARRKTVIVTTHNMDEAERVADRVAIVDRGQLLVLDTPEQLRGAVGDGEVVEIGLSVPPDDPDGVRAALAQRGEVDVADDGRSITLRARGAVATLPSILADLEAAGVVPDDLRVRGATLEDVFLELTGRRLRE